MTKEGKANVTFYFVTENDESCWTMLTCIVLWVLF